MTQIWLPTILLALALAMDAFAVALTQGARFRPAAMQTLAIALAFGAAQAVMPLIGWAIGAFAFRYVAAIDHWIAFALLVVLGGRMLLWDGADEDEPRLGGTGLLVAAIATSIDALAAGITLPTLDVEPLFAALVIGVVTAALSATGVWTGAALGNRFGKPAERLGGLVLIALGCKILAEHTGLL